ncbi:MAG: alpha/beta hydrolase [Actinomycetota bacterium]|nr:alpha/beta hydrolase [Actinomycetota bacterium]
MLLLHGQPGGARDWEAVTRALARRARVVAIDRPGWDGRSSATDLAGNARAAVLALDARQIQSATLVGHSLGAAVAVRTAVDHPDRVSALVLVAPAANRASLGALDHWLALPGIGPAISTAAMTGLGVALGNRGLRARLTRRSRLPDPYLRASGRALRSRWALHAFATEQRALVGDLRALERELPRVAVPTWIVTGTQDRIVPSVAPRRLAEQIPEARPVRLRGGHLLPQLHARQLADTIALALDVLATG